MPLTSQLVAWGYGDPDSAGYALRHITSFFPVWWTHRITRRLGLTWGYDWRSTRPDPMHFEVAHPLPQMRLIARRVDQHRR